MNIPLSPCGPENFARQPAHLRTQGESGAYLRDSSRVSRRRPFMKPPYAIGSVPSLSGHAIAYRWRMAIDGRRPNSQARTGTGEYSFFPVELTTSRIGNLTRLILAICDDHTCSVLCVFFPFILDIKFVGRTSRGHTEFFIHLRSAVRALIFLARRIQPFLSLVDHEVEFCVLTI